MMMTMVLMTMTGDMLNPGEKEGGVRWVRWASNPIQARPVASPLPTMMTFPAFFHLFNP